MRLAVALSATAFLVAGCATGARPSLATLAGDAWTPPEGRDCRLDDVPRSLPAAGALVDSAALVAALARQGPAAAVVTLRFDATGRPDRVVAIGGAADDAAAAERLVRDHVREQQPGEPWGVRLRVVSGAAPVLAVGRRVLCDARVAADHRPGGRTFVLSSAWVADGSWRRPLRVRVLVDETGEVRDARLLGSVGTPLGDERFLRGVFMREFLPPLEDGVPAERWTTLVL